MIENSLVRALYDHGDHNRACAYNPIYDLAFAAAVRRELPPELWDMHRAYVQDRIDLGSEGIDPNEHSLFTGKYAALLDHPAFRQAEADVVGLLMDEPPETVLAEHRDRTQVSRHANPNQLNLDLA